MKLLIRILCHDKDNIKAAQCKTASEPHFTLEMLIVYFGAVL